MNLNAYSVGKSLGSAFIAGIALAANMALATPVSMPTPMGPVNFDSSSFANGILVSPSGEFACFAAGSLSSCSPSTLQLAVLGPDLTTGLTLGQGGTITLAVPVMGSGLVIWEAGTQSVAGDVGGSRISLHTAAGWSAEHTYSAEHSAPVLGDTQPSGYPTNYGGFSVTEFGLPRGTVFDAVRIRSCCGVTAHADILAVAVTAVPEPSTAQAFVSGLLAVGVLGLRGRMRLFDRLPR